MAIVVILISSILLQCSAAILAFQLIPITGMRKGWILVAFGLILMAIRRGISLYGLMFNEQVLIPNFQAELVSLFISALMLIGLALMKPFFIRVRQAEIALKESEERYRNLVELCPDGIVVYLDGKVVFVNSAGLLLMRAPDQQSMIGKSVFDFVHPDYRKHVQERIGLMLEKGVSVPMIEERFVTYDGVSIDVEVTASPFTFYGKPAIQVVVRDITKRKRMEQALKESEQRYRKLVETSPDAIAVTDLNDKLLMVNQQAASLFGFQDEREVLNTVKNSIDLISPEDQQKALDNSLKTIEEGYVKNVEYRLTRKDGSSFLGEISAAVIEDDQNEPIVFIEIIRDVTDRKQAEEKIKTALDEKEVLLKETHHRIKNNLQIVSSLLNLQSVTTTDDLTLTMFKETQDRIRSIAFLHELLYQSENHEQIKLSLYVHKLVQNLMCSYGITKDLINLGYDVDDVLLEIDTAIPCGLVINELVSNTLKYAFPNVNNPDQNQIKIENKIDISIRNNNENLVTLTYSDNGIGLPPNIDIRDAKTLGLQLINALTEQLDGSLRYESKSDFGTSFTISFPGS